MNKTMICRALMTVTVLFAFAACTADEPAPTPATGPLNPGRRPRQSTTSRSTPMPTGR